jgi:replicative DNA helicase
MEYDGMQLPFNLEAEQSVLGAIVIDPPCIAEVLSILKPQYFHLPQHREIFSSMTAMFSLGQSIDAVTLLEAMKRTGTYDDAGGKQYLVQLAETVPTSKNIVSYARIVQEKYYLRSLIMASKENIQDALENGDETRIILDVAEQRIMQIRDDRGSDSLKRIDEVIVATYDRLAQISGEDRAKYLGVPTGISELDKLITGLNKSDLIILAARPGMGKTSFALNIAHNVAVHSNRGIAFFSLEMTCDQLAGRLLSSEALIDSRKLRTGELDPDDWVRLAQAADILSRAPIYFDDTSGITIAEMKAKLRRQKNIELVVIDYLQLMSSGKRSENRVQEISEITRNLKNMAKELNVPVIALSQLSRASESRSGANRKPMLSDLRDSGSIEQDADIVLFLYREDYYDEEAENKNTAEVIIAKNRHGATDSVSLHWQGQFTRFTSVDTIRNEPR